MSPILVTPWLGKEGFYLRTKRAAYTTSRKKRHQIIALKICVYRVKPLVNRYCWWRFIYGRFHSESWNFESQKL